MQELDTWADEYMVCTDFAAAYKRENENAVIKFGTVDGNDHCWVYDPETDMTVDATLSQFLSLGLEDQTFAGETHPHAEVEAEFHDVESFAKGPGGNYLLD